MGITSFHQMRLCAAFFTVGLLLSACHDTRRNNPLDPQLTPGVELSVALDDTAGTATLRWTAYAGKAPFAVYRVLRNVLDQVQVDTIAVIGEVDHLAFTDTTLSPDAFYSYRVAIVNEAGFEAVSQPQTTRPLNLPPVQIETLRFDSRTASATLAWTPYRGPRFRAYQMLRWTEGQTAQVVAEIADSATTGFTDTGLLGNTEYFYQVVVQTARDEQIASSEQSGIFHQLLASWPLSIGENEWVRLYWEETGRLAALVSSRGQVRLLSFDAQGALLAEQILFESPFTDLALHDIVPRAVTTALEADGHRLLGLSMTAPDGNIQLGGVLNVVTGVLRLDPDGLPVLRQRVLFDDVLPGPFTGDESLVQGEVFFAGTYTRVSPAVGSFVRVSSIDNVAVYEGSDLLFNEDFEAGHLDKWSFAFEGSVEDGRFFAHDDKSFSLTKIDESWRQFRLEADVAFRFAGFTSLGIGSMGAFSSVLLTFRPNARLLELAWFFTQPPDTGPSQSLSLEMPYIFLPGVNYRPALEVVDGQISASMQSPVI